MTREHLLRIQEFNVNNNPRIRCPTSVMVWSRTRILDELDKVNKNQSKQINFGSLTHKKQNKTKQNLT